MHYLLLLHSPNPRPCLDYQKYTFKVCLRSGLQRVDIVCILEGAACGLSHQAQLMCISYLHYVGERIVLLFETKSRYVAQVGLELVTLLPLPLPPKYLYDSLDQYPKCSFFNCFNFLDLFIFISCI